MEKIEDHIDLSLIEQTFQIPLLGMMGLTAQELESVKPQLQDWGKSIDIHNLSLKKENAIPAIPAPMYREIAQYCDITFAHCSLVARGMLWYSICDALINYSTKSIDLQMRQEITEKIITELKKSGIEPDTNINPINN